VVRAAIGKPAGRLAPHLVANTELGGFRCALAELAPAADTVELPAELAAALGVHAGGAVRVIPL
jgi:arginine N-succinyltransferase